MLKLIPSASGGGGSRHTAGISTLAWASASLPGGSHALPSSEGSGRSSLVSVGDEGAAGLWNADGEWQGSLFTVLDDGVIDLHANPACPDALAAGCSDGMLRLLSAAGGREEKRVVASPAGGAIVSVRWSYDGSALCTGGEDGCVKVWSGSGALRTTLATCAGPVYAVRWGADSNSLLWASGADLFLAGLTAEAGGGKGGAGRGRNAQRTFFSSGFLRPPPPGALGPCPICAG